MIFGPKTAGIWPAGVSLIGPTGSTGATGAQGPIGPVGPQGTQGLTGAIGATGATGPQGPIGLTGSQGPQGATGATGATGPQGAGYTAGSTTSLAIGVGSKTFTTQSGLAYTVGARVRAASNATPTNYMEGLVTSYVGSTLVINADTTGGSGTAADWNINLAGNVGATGASGPQGAIGPQGATGATGATGAQGPAGATGGTGATGPQGPPGPQGPAGTSVPPSARTVATSETTASTTYTSLTTAGPAVTVSVSAIGSALVILTAELVDTSNSGGCLMSFGTGAASTASDTTSLESDNPKTAPFQGSATYLVTGLTAGSVTFTAYYRADPGVTCTFANRSIIVFPY